MALCAGGSILYSVVKYCVAADGLAIRAKLSCFLQVVSVYFQINHHLDNLFELVIP